MKTLTLRLSKYYSDFLPELQEMTNEKTASKAILKIIESYGYLQDVEHQKTLYIENLQRENQELMQIIENARLSSIAFSQALQQQSFFGIEPNINKIC